MDAFTICSPSHVPLLERFLAPSAARAGFALTTVMVDQRCPTGRYYEPGWRETMTEKVELLQRLSVERRGHVFLYTDCDVLFNPREFTPEAARRVLGDAVIALQDDVVQLCCGFMVLRGSTDLDDLLMRTRALIEPCGDDQTALNRALGAWRSRAARLPARQFASVRQLRSARGANHRWHGRPFRVPRRLKIFHANWTEGVGQKAALLTFVSEQLERAPAPAWRRVFFA